MNRKPTQRPLDVLDQHLTPAQQKRRGEELEAFHKKTPPLMEGMQELFEIVDKWEALAQRQMSE